MEQPAITLLKNVNLNQDDYTIKVRIVRLWSRAAFNDSRKVYCYDMILMDEEVRDENSSLCLSQDCQRVRTFVEGEAVFVHP
ncbi:hypothetical protein HanPSC8_Chr10g0412191 [Helianthus annuus]|nr:hypothetical protein HanPSC8_Chr10g0412191 [Helianthus annuus]